MQLENVSEMANFEQLHEKTVHVGKDYLTILTLKLQQLKEVIDVESRLISTAPKPPTSPCRLDEETIKDKKMKEAINQVSKGPTKITFYNVSKDLK